MRYSGRHFSALDREVIRTLIAEHPTANRAGLSRLVCTALDWRRADGRLKDMSCRVVMLRMYRDGLIELPSPQTPTTTADLIGAAHHRRTPSCLPSPGAPGR